jgi:hypothetical protein
MAKTAAAHAIAEVLPWIRGACLPSTSSGRTLGAAEHL